MGRHIYSRDGRWYYRRRVPTDLVERVGRKHIAKSLRTACEATAIKKAAAIDREIEREWSAIQDSRIDAARERHSAIQTIARKMGFAYTPAEDLAEGPLIEITRRLEALMSVTPSGQQPATDVRDAVLGLSDAPTVATAAIAGEYFKLVPEMLKGKGKRGQDRFMRPREKAAREFLEIIGDKGVAEVTRKDMLAYRDFLWARHEAGEILIDTVNKQIGQLATMLRTIGEKHDIDVCRLDQLTFKNGEGNRRPPMPHDVIVELMKPGRLDGLNDEARRIFYTLVMTGARPLEIAGLMPDDIRLSANVPHILIRPNANRKLKNRSSERAMPLAGVALDAIRAQPEGFPRYMKAADASAAINKFLRENEMLPEGCTVYSLRHSFSDYLKKITADTELRAALMGHKYTGEIEYGSGHDLHDKLAVLEQIPLTSPGVV